MSIENAVYNIMVLARLQAIEKALTEKLGVDPQFLADETTTIIMKERDKYIKMAGTQGAKP